MLFFRSEEALADWLAETRAQRGPSCDLDQLWGLAVAWYSSRLSPDSRRPQPDEIRSILAGLDLSDPLWDPFDDAF